MASATHTDPADGTALRNILVSVDLDLDTDTRLKLTADLADRFSSRIIGAAAREMMVPVVAEGGMMMQTDLLEEERRIAQRDLDQAEALFRRTVGLEERAEWRSEIEIGRYWLCEQARAADLVVCGARPRDGARGGSLRVDPGDVVMSLGRPLLVVPSRMDVLKAQNIVIGWKNAREARRAVSDALPFLMRAESVIVAALGDHPDAEGARDVAEYLRRYDVVCVAATERTGRTAASVAEELWGFASRSGADLVVCGAYGHGRMREWVFGGVTRDLIADTRTACLMSH